jgi:hypothetical protein
MCAIVSGRDTLVVMPSIALDLVLPNRLLETA